MWKAPTIRGCASVSALALNGAPKSMGRKGNGRKRSNKKKKADIEEVVNILMKMKSRLLCCIHYLQTLLIVKMKKPLMKNI